MEFIDDLKIRLKELIEKMPEYKESAVDKIKTVGDGGQEITKNIVREISDKVNDISKFTRLKSELNNLDKDLESEYLSLGQAYFKMSKARKNKDGQLKEIADDLEKIGELKTTILKKTIEYENIKTDYSENYVIRKLSDELTEAGAIIDQALVSEKSDVSGKLLKEIVLPKEALITAIKRGDDIIIPDGNTKLNVGDLITIFGKEGDVRKVVNRISGAS